MSDKERKEYEAYLADLSYQASMVSSTYGVGKFEGRKEGRKEGREEGREEGKALSISCCKMATFLLQKQNKK